MKILVTGSAGFIGSALTLRLLARGDQVFGIDNHNAYYDPVLKEARLARYSQHPNYRHYRIDLADQQATENVFDEIRPDNVVHLAAQAGVRYSLENPLTYISSNIVGFAHVLEGCRRHHVQHLVYASSSSVYGANTQLPFSTHDNADHPLNLYAASKKSNEMMAHAYSHIYQLPTTGLRFFTVYGPWGRPDMALFKFAESIVAGKPITIFNHGNHQRDFTYIDDIVEGIVRVLAQPAAPNLQWNGNAPDAASSTAPWRIYNIGNHQPVALLTYIEALEQALGRKAEKEFLPLQAGDMHDTFADISDLQVQFDYQPKTSIQDGIAHFIAWYREYHKLPLLL